MRTFAYDVKPGTDGHFVSRRAVSLIIGAFLLMTLLLFAACSDADEADPGVSKAPSPAAPAVVLEAPKGLIKADPNPVPADSALIGKTKISWNTVSDMGPVAIVVSSNGEPEVAFAGGEKEGATEAPWIQAGVEYDFRLYVGTGANKKLIDHVTVTRNK